MSYTSKSELEQVFDAYWRLLAPCYDVPINEHRFHSTRKWRFDKAWVEQKVAVEIDGGTFSGGRHVRGMGYHKQIEKQNAAMLANWAVLRFDTKHIHDDPALMVEVVKQALDSRVAHGQIDEPITCTAGDLVRDHSEKIATHRIRIAGGRAFYDGAYSTKTQICLCRGNVRRYVQDDVMVELILIGEMES